MGEGSYYRLVASHTTFQVRVFCAFGLYFAILSLAVTSPHLSSPSLAASGFSGQRRARATSASSSTPVPPFCFVCLFLVRLCGFSSSCALWPFVLCSLLLPLSLFFLFLCLDLLTKDCQGFLPLRPSHPPAYPLLKTYCCVRCPFQLAVYRCGVVSYLVSLSPYQSA